MPRPATGTSVPLLDVRRQNARLRTEIGAAIDRVWESSAFIHGPACDEFEAAIADYCGTRHAIGCASGSDALLLALMALGVGPGDEVLLPSFTFFATAGAVWRIGATPVFVDIDPATFNLDPDDAARKITPATKVIIPVHLFGQCADMAALLPLAEQHGLAVIEDAAQAIGATYEGRRAGSLGNLGCFSFYPTKNLGGFGDGGMITTDDAALDQRLRVLRDHGQQPRYHHAVVGINSRLDTLQAAVLNVKLSRLEQWAAARRKNAARYETLIDAAGLVHHVALPGVDRHCESVWNQYTIRVVSGDRDRVQSFLTNQGIGSAIYYPLPLHLQPCFASLGYAPGSLPQTEQACREVLSLPIYPELDATEQSSVVAALAEFFARESASETLHGRHRAHEAAIRLAS
jgi:dTDP-4-amino-4,6-dideoxygalactose transaminase